MAFVSHLALMNISCSKRSSNSAAATSEQTLKQNEKRQALSLRQIHSNWHLYRTEFGAEDWKLKPTDRYLAKRVQRDAAGNLKWEEDYYYSGATFITPKGQNWEMLTIHFDYTTQTVDLAYIGQDSAISDVIKKQNGANTELEERLATADQILKKWGHSRR